MEKRKSIKVKSSKGEEKVFSLTKPKRMDGSVKATEIPKGKDVKKTK